MNNSKKLVSGLWKRRMTQQYRQNNGFDYNLEKESNFKYKRNSFSGTKSIIVKPKNDIGIKNQQSNKIINTNKFEVKKKELENVFQRQIEIVDKLKLIASKTTNSNEVSNRKVFKK